MKKILIATFIFVGMYGAMAQQQEISIENWCGTAQKMNEFRNDPANRQMLRNEEIYRQQEQENGIVAPKGIVYEIPIVFHILHNGGSENVSEAQIFNALDVLNRDFRLQNADTVGVLAQFKPLYADIEIQFVLATKAPNGDCFRGYTRTESSLSFVGSNGGDQVDAIVAGNDVYNGQWPGNKYLNVFVVGDAGGAGGYTTNPGAPNGSSMTNGIWILYTQFGEIGTSNLTAGRSLTHECGHWLNLDHTWGNSNTPGCDGTATVNTDPCWNTAWWAGPIGPIDNCNGDDGVADTPLCIGTAGGCNLAENSCGPIANVQNYMDYALSCQSMFTQGQKTRMRNAIVSGSGGRNNLWTASNLAATGAGEYQMCEAEFSANRTSVCQGEQIQFTDESYNNANGWTWTFPGGTPASSTAQNPLITYNTMGLYEVTLTATDGGTNDNEVKTAYIRVLQPPSTVPFLEDFESFSTLTSVDEWEIINGSGNAEWMLETTVGQTGTKCAKLLNNGQPNGSMDELIAAPVDLSAVTSLTLSFRYAYKRKNTSDDDWFRVYASGDCGASWAIRKTLHGFQMSSQTQTSAFVPASQADWTTIHMTNIINSYWVDNFRYKFTFEAGGGNNMYLDNINIYEGSPSDNLVVGLSEGEGVSGLSVYPNPVDDELNVRFGVNSAQDVMIRIQDLSGKMAQNNLIHANEGSNLVFVNTNELAAGMYFLQIQVGETNQTVQFVVK